MASLSSRLTHSCLVCREDFVTHVEFSETEKHVLGEILTPSKQSVRDFLMKHLDERKFRDSDSLVCSACFELVAQCDRLAFEFDSCLESLKTRFRKYPKRENASVSWSSVTSVSQVDFDPPVPEGKPFVDSEPEDFCDDFGADPLLDTDPVIVPKVELLDEEKPKMEGRICITKRKSTKEKTGEQEEERKPKKDKDKPDVKERGVVKSYGKILLKRKSLKNGKMAFKVEKRKIAEVSIFRCRASECKARFSTSRSRGLHETRGHRNGYDFKCATCGEAYFDLTRLEEHKLKTHGKKACTHCNIDFPYCTKEDEAAYDNHLISHNSKRGESGHNNYSPRGTFTPRGKHLCQDCGKFLPSAKSLAKHMEVHQAPKEKTDENLLCDCCGVTFKCGRSMWLHRNRTSGPCEICGQNVKNLASHRVLMHGAKKQPSCPDCGQKCKNSRHLQQHRHEAHGAENPKLKYKHFCHVCGRHFWHRPYRDRHLATVHGLEPDPSKIHKCEICGKEFFAQTSYTEHVNNHLGIHPFQCPLCDFSSSMGPNLHGHMRNVHKMKLVDAKKLVEATANASTEVH